MPTPGKDAGPNSSFSTIISNPTLWVEVQSRKTSESCALNTIVGGVRKLTLGRVKCD
jgi:hypothetical protein